MFESRTAPSFRAPEACGGRTYARGAEAGTDAADAGTTGPIAAGAHATNASAAGTGASAGAAGADPTSAGPASSDDLGTYLHTITELRNAYAEVVREISRLEAEKASILAELVSRTEATVTPGEHADIRIRSAAAELAAATHQSQPALTRQLDSGYTLVTSYPATHAALAEGTLTLQHANAITNAGSALPETARAAFDTDAARLATGTSPNRLRAKLRLLSEKHHPTTLQERHDHDIAYRDVWVRDLENGLAELGATLSAVHAHSIHDRLTRAAKAARRKAAAPPTVDGDGFRMSNSGAGADADADADAGAESTADTASAGPQNASEASDTAPSAHIPESRTIAQLRTDLFVELLLTGSPALEDCTAAAVGLSGIAPQIMLTLPVDGITGHAYLPGHGPIDPDTARRLTAAAPGWDRIGITPENQIVATDRYRVTEAIRRALTARDERCRFIGCRAPASRCDIDHTVEWASNGATTIVNTSHLCRAHHALKHPDVTAAAKWRVRQHPDGTLTWTAPTGAEYIDSPERGYSGARRAPRTPSATTHAPSATGRTPSATGRTPSATGRTPSTSGHTSGSARSATDPGSRSPGETPPQFDVPF